MFRDSKRPQLGQRYRAVRLDGTLSPVTWEVIELFENEVDGLTYARLRQTDDRSRVKSVGAIVLADGSQFRPLAEAALG